MRHSFHSFSLRAKLEFINNTTSEGQSVGTHEVVVPFVLKEKFSLGRYEKDIPLLVLSPSLEYVSQLLFVVVDLGVICTKLAKI